jgi:hypothetical protein
MNTANENCHPLGRSVVKGKPRHIALEEYISNLRTVGISARRKPTIQHKDRRIILLIFENVSCPNGNFIIKNLSKVIRKTNNVDVSQESVARKPARRHVILSLHVLSNKTYIPR